MKIYFATTSAFKARELTDFFSTVPAAARAAIDVVVFASDLPEVLDSDIDRIVTFKALAAYQLLGLPCIVEHSGLFMDALPGLPGGLGQIIWQRVGDRMCDFLRPTDSRAATARSVIGYCDGRHVNLYGGETRGSVAGSARGDYAFNWDPIFIPEGGERTYGEMGLEAKRETSPVHKAWQRFVNAVLAPDASARD